jgi:formylglycine-generating enzyme required for sulfatase activity
VERRAELAKLYAGVDDNPQAEYELARQQHEKSGHVIAVKPEKYTPPSDPFTEFRCQVSGAYKPETRTVDLGGGKKITLVKIPAGSYLMGSLEGYPDEAPRRAAKIGKAFWMAETETTNGQYEQFDPAHDTRYIDEHGKDHTTPGYIANHPDQPVARISWQEADAFCEWLGKKSGLKVALPTEEQWEWAARAGSGEHFFFGGTDADFSQYANMADESLRSLGHKFGGGSKLNKLYDYDDQDNFPLRDNRFNDGHIQPALVGAFKASPWGLKDIIGNVCEWTGSDYAPISKEKKVARGGSWSDRPMSAGSATRYPYLPWQKVYNVGFRIIVEE